MPGATSSRAPWRRRSATRKWSRSISAPAIRQRAMPEPLLRIDGLAAGYDRMQVLWDVGLEVAERETVVLLGANGAGKTTLLRALLGLLPAWHGTIGFAGHDISHLRTDRRVRHGMAYMSEMAVFAGLSIEENIRIGGQFL